MKIIVTGATGFVGRYVVPELLSRKHNIIAVARNLNRAKEMPWYKKVKFFSYDIHDATIDPTKILEVPDAIIHLAWPGLPNYKDLFHFERNLPADYRFLKNMIKAGTKHVIVTGTCLEYGMQNGSLSENDTTKPCAPYGLAKDTLRKFLQTLQTKHPFFLQWVRLFYTYGIGQNPNSLLSQLDNAIDNQDKIFNMSEGDQLRDYLPVEEIAQYLVAILENSECSGIINCCSGKPISIRYLIEQRIAERKANIKLNLGYYKYPDYEPMAFWGCRKKLNSILDKK